MFKPMLAPQTDPMSYPNFFKEIRYPLMVSPKLDGIRCITKDNTCMSRTFKPLPSYQVHGLFHKYKDLDGEVLEGQINDPYVYNRTQSHVMSRDKPGEISFNVFDYCHEDWLNKPFYERYEKTKELVTLYDDCKLNLVEHELIENEKELLEYEDYVLSLGFEGLICRDPLGRYKCGRGTWLEGIIFKLKRFQEDEGFIIGFEEAEENTNIPQLDELGYLKRSSKKEGKQPKGMLGNFYVDFEGVVVRVAPGVFTHDDRIHIWRNPNLYINKILKFRHFPHGAKNTIRHARAVGFRDLMDM